MKKIYFAAFLMLFMFPLASKAAGLDSLTFPIAELGGCASKQDCKTYCDNIDHADACLTFAQAHGLMTKDEVAGAKKVTIAIKADGRPGNCAGPEDCRKYCSDKSHADECLAFAQKHNLISKEDVSRVGKIVDLIKNGKTPGGCDSKDSCETYCSDSSHSDECLKFAADIGIIKSEDIQARKQLMQSGGPGGCSSKEACHEYCNDSAHQQECMDFAKIHNLVKKEDAQATDQSTAQLRTGLNLPDLAKHCLAGAVDDSTLQQIHDGDLIPDSDTAAKIKTCLDQAQTQIKKSAQDLFKSAPPEVKACLQQNVPAGLQKLQNGTAPSVEDADKIKNCLHKNGQERNGNNGEHNGQSSIRIGEPSPQDQQPPRSINDIPAPIQDCLLKTFGSEWKSQMQSGKLTSEMVQKATQECGIAPGDTRGPVQQQLPMMQPPTGQLPPPTTVH